MNIEKWIEENASITLKREYVHVAALRALLKTHAIVETKYIGKIKEILKGCSNGCRFNIEKRQVVTNGQCHCLVDANRAQLQMLQGVLAAMIAASEAVHEN